jgi:hypothetical protein
MPKVLPHTHEATTTPIELHDGELHDGEDERTPRPSLLRWHTLLSKEHSDSALVKHV